MDRECGRSVNAHMGKQVEGILEMEPRFYVTDTERTRLGALETSEPGCIQMRRCRWYNSPDGCRKGVQCDCWHMEELPTYTRRR